MTVANAVRKKSTSLEKSVPAAQTMSARIMPAKAKKAVRWGFLLPAAGDEASTVSGLVTVGATVAGGAPSSSARIFRVWRGEGGHPAQWWMAVKTAQGDLSFRLRGVVPYAHRTAMQEVLQ